MRSTTLGIGSPRGGTPEARVARRSSAWSRRSFLLISLCSCRGTSLAHEAPGREAGDGGSAARRPSCTGFETFPILRWLLIAAAVAPLILTYIVVRGHKLS